MIELFCPIIVVDANKSELSYVLLNSLSKFMISLSLLAVELKTFLFLLFSAVDLFAEKFVITD